jgi:hypothetical protein
VIHITTVAGTATASAAPIERRPNTAPYKTEAYKAGIGELEEAREAAYHDRMERRRRQEERMRTE